jgi:hypothetical protein
MVLTIESRVYHQGFFIIIFKAIVEQQLKVDFHENIKSCKHYQIR